MKLTVMKSEAAFNEDRTLRYSLLRQWDLSKPFVLFIGLNPSTANEENNDATIRRCMNFAERHNYGGMIMANLFTIVSTDPSVLEEDRGIESGTEINTLKTLADVCKAVVFAWGAFKGDAISRQANLVIEAFPEAFCLGKNSDGSPKHPLYLSASTQLTPYYAKSSIETIADNITGYIEDAVKGLSYDHAATVAKLVVKNSSFINVHILDKPF